MDLLNDIFPHSYDAFRLGVYLKLRLAIPYYTTFLGQSIAASSQHSSSSSAGTQVSQRALDNKFQVRRIYNAIERAIELRTSFCKLPKHFHRWRWAKHHFEIVIRPVKVQFCWKLEVGSDSEINRNVRQNPICTLNFKFSNLFAFKIYENDFNLGKSFNFLWSALV